MTDAEYQKLLADERTRVATAAAGLPKGSGTVYLAAEGGERMAQGVRSMLGIENPAITAHKEKEAKQLKLNNLLMKYKTMTTREDYQNAINELFANGFPEHAAKVSEMMGNLPDEKGEDTLTTKESTMEMAAQFHQCAIDAGGWQKADQECKAAVKKTFVEMQRGTWEEAGMIAGAKEEAKAIQATQTNIYLDSDASRDSMASIQQSIDLLPGLYSGTAGEGISNFKTLLVSLGIIDESRSIEEAQFLRNSMQSVTDWIALTKGSISDKEMDAFVAASPGLQKTRAGNLLILETMKAAADYHIRLETEWNNWKDKADKTAKASGIPVSQVEWRIHLERWYRTNKVKLPTVAQIKEALKPDSEAEETTSTYEVSID